MVVDHVYCGKCGKEMYVNIGVEVCPFCGKYGMLQWVNPEEPEVELNYEPSKTKLVGIVEHGDKTEYAIGDTDQEAIEEAARFAGDDEITHYYTEEIYYEEV